MDRQKNAAFGSPAPGEPVITYPVEGAVFYFDEQLPPEMQAFRVEVVHSPEETPVLFLNSRRFLGTPDTSGEVLTTWLVPLTRGSIRLEVHREAVGGEMTANEYAVRHIQVK